MGNCCLGHESDIIWGGDNWGSAEDWGSPKSEKIFRKDTRRGEWIREKANPKEDENEMLLGLGEKKKKETTTGKTGVGQRVPSDDVATEVNIKITKKQLEEWMGNVANLEPCAQQMLTHQRSRRPALQSILEIE